MQTYLNTATNLLQSRASWILSLPQAILSPGETWDSLFDELLDLGLFVEAPVLEVAEEWTSTSSTPPGIWNPTEMKGAFHE